MGAIYFLLKASACLAVFYTVYLLLFMRTDRFQLNRVYLLAGLVLSFALPVVVIPGTPVGVIEFASVPWHETPESLQVADITNPEPVNASFIIYYSYYAGAGIALIITLLSISRSYRLYSSAQKSKNHGQTIVVHPAVQPSSFLGVLFIRSLNEDPIIIAHEMVHIRQRHWIDLVLMEIAAIVLWFNPFIYFYRRSIALQHEYIADHHVLSEVPVKAYLNCIAQHLESNILSPLVSRFNTRSIKQRIIMMTRTSTYSAARYAVVLPVIIILTMAFATRGPMQNQELRSPIDVTKAKTRSGGGFGKRIHPLTGKERFHTGVDFELPSGNDVYAASNGTVVEARSDESHGNLIVIQHDKRLTTRYSHLEKMLVKKGDRVERGQLVGLVGSTGLSTGPHLHFEVLENGKAVDPVPYLNMSVD